MGEGGSEMVIVSTLNKCENGIIILSEINVLSYKRNLEFSPQPIGQELRY